MVDRVKPEDEVFLVAYPYFNVNGRSKLGSFSVDISKECFMNPIPFSFRNACC